MTPPSATAPAPGPAPVKRGGPPAWVALVAIGSLLVGVLLIVLQVLGVGFREPGPAPTLPPPGQASDVTRALVVSALERASFQVQDPRTEYRPGESPELMGVPRRLVQAVLPGDPSGGYVVIYELPSANEADRVGRELLDYLAGGTGAIQYPRDTQFVVQRVGRTLVFFPWSAEASPDAPLAEMAAALETVGTPVRPSP
jgi:hypothetical protein